MNSFKPRVRSEHLIIQNLGDEVLIYDIEHSQAHCLNGSAARVWSLCDGEKTVAEIAQIVAPDVEPITGESLVWCALDQFRERHLMDDSEEAVPDTVKSAEITRRQMILRLGLVVGLTVPLVESIVSPPAALASSIGVSGGTGGSTP